MTATIAGRIDRIVLRAAVYQALALGYAYPAISQRARLVDLLTTIGSRAQRLRTGPPPGVEPLWRAAASADQSSVEADFNRLFSGEVLCPPHETAYEPDVFRRQRTLADIAGFHAAFGFELPDDSRWQADHVGVELEFVAQLLDRQALAEEHRRSEPAEVCDDAVRAFLLDHIGRWYAGFARGLVRRASSRLYRELARATDAWLRDELARYRLHPEPLAARARTTEDDTPPACGACPVAAPTR